MYLLLVYKNIDKMNEIKTVNINLWSGPGVGKSTTAATLFAELKKRRISCELVREFAKDLVWENRIGHFEQFWITAEQHRRQSILQGQAQVVITDSAIPMGIFHAPLAYQQELKNLIFKMISNWNSIDVLLYRDMTEWYEQNGRVENLSASLKKHESVSNLIKEFNESFISCHVNDIEVILSEVERRLLSSK